MAIPLIGSDDALFPRLGRLGRVLYGLHGGQDGTDSTLADYLDRYPGAESDLVAALAANRESLTRSIPSALAGQFQAAARATLLKMVRDDAPTRARTVAEAMAELIAQMNASNATVKACVVTSNTTAFAGNLGAQTVVVSTKRGDGREQENLFGESARIQCVTDSRTGGTLAGAEQFQFVGSQNLAGPFDWDFVETGSGGAAAAASASALRDAPAGSNRLANGGFDSWNANNTVPVQWVTTGTLSKETSLTYGAGAAAVRVAASNTATLTQEFGNATDGTASSPAVLTSLAFALRIRGSAALSGGTLRVGLWDGTGWMADASGTNSYEDFALSGVGTSYAARSGVVRFPAVMPDTVYFRLAVTAAPVGGALIIDHLQAAPLTAAYPGGPGFAVFAGDTPALAGDGWDVALTNARGGNAYGATFQTLFDRLFGMRGLNLLLPSAASPTIGDGLILEGPSVVGPSLLATYLVIL